MCSIEPLGLGDIVLQKVFVKRVSGLQPADKYERRYLLTAIEDLGKLAMEEIDVGFCTISWPHFDGEEMVGTPLGFLTSSILYEEG